MFRSKAAVVGTGFMCIEAAERVKRGDIGEIFHISGSYVQDWLHKPTDFNWRVLSEQGGSLRALADIGTHWLDLVQTICQLEIQSVCADLQTVYPTRRRPVEADKTSDTIRFADYPTFEDGHREVLLCEAILKSDQEQRWIELTTNGT